MFGGETTGLRQRRVALAAADDENNGNNLNNAEERPPLPRRLAPIPRQHLLQQQQQQAPPEQQQPQFVWKVSHIYCLVSALLAILAVITSSAPGAATTAATATSGRNKLGTPSSVVDVVPTALAEKHHHYDPVTNSNSNSAAGSKKVVTTNPVPSSLFLDVLDADWWRQAMNFLFTSGTSQPPAVVPRMEEKKATETPTPWWKAVFGNTSSKSSSKKQQQQQPLSEAENTTTNTATWWQTWVEPSLLQPSTSTITDLIDKVLTSTPRLLAIANLLLALTYQMHTAVADWFLGTGVPPPGDWAMNGRERLGSFLVFKLLLISAVVAPDTLDLLILLSWYTLLSFLRSLAHLAAGTTTHTSQSGQPPRSGVLQLLLLVLLSDFVAAAICVALFQLAGWHMVFLLTCDCALLAVEVLGHVLKHFRQVLEDMHDRTIAEMEEEQVRIHTRQRRIEGRQQQNHQHHQQEEDVVEGNNIAPPARAPALSEDGLDDVSLDGDVEDDEDDGIRTLHRNNPHLLREDSHRLDQAMDDLGVAHSRRLWILDFVVFILQLIVQALTIGHFLHIWYLHGIQFTLIDGVLALHLHSAISAFSKEIVDRDKFRRLDMVIDKLYTDATELDLEKANLQGDVCSICLGAMSVLGTVKKVGCGHLYHKSCLREVVERAPSIEAAKCPLCRAYLVDGSHSETNNGNGPAQVNPGDGEAAEEGVNNNNVNGGINAANGNNADNNGDPRAGGVDHRERALFRFSTEGILPAWMPLPAFSFEVVRRPARQEAPANNNNNNNNAGRGRNNNNNANNNHNNNNRNQQSFSLQMLSSIRRLIMPMPPEEEARILTSLVDMYPQYDRADLLRELRSRGSVELVVDAIEQGALAGRARWTAENEANNSDNENNEGSEDELVDGLVQQADIPPQQQVEPVT